MLPVTAHSGQRDPAEPLARRRRPASRAVAVYRAVIDGVEVEARYFAEPDEISAPVLGELLLVSEHGVSITGSTLRAISTPQWYAAAVLGEHSGDDNFRVTRPDGTVDWWEEFATTFLRAAATTTAPAQTIADQSGVPVSAVHRWTREARMKGLLPKDPRGPRPRRREQ